MPPNLLISHALWRDAFSSDPAAIGRTISIAQGGYEIVGVMAAGFHSPAMAGPATIALTPAYTVWSPFIPRPVHYRRGNRGLRVLARVPSGAHLDATESSLAGLSRQLASNYPDTNDGRTARLVPLADAISGSSRRPLQGIAAAGLLLLIIACSNAAGLALVRTVSRSREWSAPFALGASPHRLRRQLLVESGLLSLAGTAAGLGVAALLLNAGQAVFTAVDLPRLSDAALGWRAFTLGILLGCAAGAIMGLMSSGALRRLGARLEAPGARTSGDPKTTRLRRALVAMQVALAVTLTVAATLLVTSVSRLVTSHGLQDASRTLVFQTTTAGTRWAAAPADRQLYASLRDRILAVPGVESVAFTTQILTLGDQSSSDLVVDGEPRRAADERPLSLYTLADEEFLRMSGVTVREGRTFNHEDAAEGPRAAILNEAFVAAAGIQGSAVGRMVGCSPSAPAPSGSSASSATRAPASLVASTDHASITTVPNSLPAASSSWCDGVAR